MKKSLLRLLIATLAFFVGTFAAKIYLVKYQFVFAPSVESVKIEESKTVKSEIFETPQEEISYQNNDKNNFSGWYSLENNNKMPEVSMILLSKLSFDYEEEIPSKSVELNAGIYTTLSEDIDEGFAEGVSVIIENDKVKFKTKKLKGIEYRFEGFFFKNKTSGENGEEILRGTLQKYIKGKKVAQMSGDFAYYEPHCLH